MPLVACKCTNCGANLQVDNTKDAAICQYCGSAFIVEKAINNYNVTNHISAEVVNIYGGNSADFVIRAGCLEKYTGASIEVVIPNSVTQIGPQSFRGCAGLTSITIPNSVISIGKQAFQGCTNLTNIVISNGVNEIGDEAFRDCAGLSSVTIPDSVTEIGNEAFRNCTGLTSMVIPNSVTKIGKHGFDGCTSLTNVTIPDGMTTIEQSTFLNCISLTSVTIPNSITIIAENSFRGCTSLTSVTIPDSVSRIESGAFGGCTNLSDVTIPKGVIYNKESVFFNCPKLESGRCYIATAVYGSYDCQPVWTLRRFRDDSLATTWQGRAFIRLYYAVSPTLVRWFGKTTWFQKFWRTHLDKLVTRLNNQGVKDTPYQDQNW